MAAHWSQPMLELAQNVSSQALNSAATSKPLFSLDALPSHILYAGTDLNTLSWIEKLWAAWYIKIGDPVLATGILAFIMHEFVYFGRCIPFMIMDMIPYFKRWKLQDNKAPTWEQQWKCTKLVLLTHFTVELPQIWGFHPMAEYLGMATHRVPFPSWTTMAWQIGLFFFLEDMWHYWAHRTMHEIPYLYKNIHKLHHEFSAPFGLAAEYAHPIEILILGIGTIGGPLLVCALMGGNVHLFTVLVFITLRLFQAVDAHSGYDFPISLRHFVPFWSGADHHDFHHMNFIGCYSTSFRWWDHFMGTDSSYQRYKLRKAAAKLQGNEMNYVPYEMEGKAREQALLNKADGKAQ